MCCVASATAVGAAVGVRRCTIHRHVANRVAETASKMTQRDLAMVTSGKSSQPCPYVEVERCVRHFSDITYCDLSGGSVWTDFVADG